MNWLEELENIYNVDMDIQHPNPTTVNVKRLSTALRLLVEVGKHGKIVYDALDFEGKRECPHGNGSTYPTSGWFCDECLFALRDALDAALANPDCKALLEGEDETVD